MSAFDSNYNGGYTFNTTSGNPHKKAPSGNGSRSGGSNYDDRYGGSGRGMYNGRQQRGNQEQRGAARPFQRRRPEPDADIEEVYDDYRPGSRLMVKERLFDSFENFRRDKMDADDFDDDDFGDADNMTDDFDDNQRRKKPPRRPRPIMPDLNGSRRKAGSRDYTDDDYYSEFGSVRGISSEAERFVEDNRGYRPVFPGSGGGSYGGGNVSYSTDGRAAGDDDPEDGDGYFGRATIRDRGFDGRRVPKFIDDFYRDAEDYDSNYNEYGGYGGKRRDDRRSRQRPIVQLSRKRTVVRNEHLQGVKGFRLSSKTIAAVSAACVVAAVIFGVSYLSFLRVTAPLNVSTALTAMQGSVSSSLLRSSVDSELASKTIQVTANGMTSVMSLAECEFRFSSDPDGTERKEWGKSVTDSDVQYTYMTKGSICFNETKVKDFLHKASGVQGVRMIEPDYKVDIRQDRDTKVYTGSLTITKGSDGYGVDFDSFIDELLKHISTDDLSPISVELTNTIAPPVDVDKIYDEVHTVAADSYKRTDGTGQVIYEPEIIGVDFDKRAAADKIAAGGSEWVINLALTIPKVSRKELMAETFPDLLSTYSTAFNANNQARSSNLALAGDYINGTILQPGEVFSYNNVVGERTRERGFCKATVYSSEGTEEDYGGGICQTSSTLFYCAMKANLELVKRTNHLYTVNYMVDEKGQPYCYGNDATVNWGKVDMQFRNNKEYPIKIECITKNGVITFNIWGTWDGYTAEYRYVEQEYEPYQIMYRRYKEGKKNQAGQRGRTIWTYRVIFYQADPNVGEREEVERYREFISVYRPLTQIKYVTSPPPGYQFDVAYHQ